MENDERFDFFNNLTALAITDYSTHSNKNGI